MEEINVPYRKQYNAMGSLLNPINGVYKSEHRNRKQRRAYLQKERFANNKNTAQMVIIGKFRFKKVRQRIVDKYNKSVKFINHLIPVR